MKYDSVKEIINEIEKYRWLKWKKEKIF
jgi:hypothetical protein